MKKNYFKKSLSLVLTVLMLMSCWVFVAPEHNHAEAAASTSSATAAINTAALNEINTNVDINVDTTSNYYKFKIYGNGDDGGDNTEARQRKYYKNILSHDGDTSLKGDNNRGSYFSNVTNSELTVSIVYPTMVLKYDGVTTPKFGIMLEGDSASKKKIRFERAWMDANSNGLTFNPNYWMGIASNDSAFFYIMENSAKKYLYAQDTSNGDKFDARAEGQWEFLAASLEFTGSLGATEWVRTISPTWKFNNGSTTYTGTNTSTIYVMNFKGYKDLLDQINTQKNNILSNPGDYTPASVRNFVNAAKNIISCNPKNSTAISNVTTWNNNMNTYYSAYTTAVNKLAKREFEVGYENLFSLTDWYYSNSSRYTDNNNNIVTDLSAGTIKINNPTNDGSTEYVTGATTGTLPATNYAMPVTAGSTYYVTYKTSGATSTEVFFMWKDSSGNTISYSSKYFTGDATHWGEFTAPTGAVSVELRFDNNTDGTNVTFSDIAVYEKTRADEIGIKEWGNRAVRKVYSYGASIGADLSQPTRPGYIFKNWKVDIDGDASGDTGTSSYTKAITEHTVVYSEWESRYYDIGYDNLFSVAEWSQTKSNRGANGNVTGMEVNVQAGTIAVTGKSDAYTTYGGGSDQYHIPVTVGETYVFDYDATSTNGTFQAFVFFYNDKAEGVTGAIYNGSAQTNAHIGLYNGQPITFTVPEGCTKVGFRVGICGDSEGTATYSNIGFYKKVAYDEYAKNYSTIRVPFRVGDTTELTYRPARTGYVFSGWVDANGDAITSVAGLSASDTVYATWTNLWKVTFKNYDGSHIITFEVENGKSVETPDEPARDPDATNHYAFEEWNGLPATITSDVEVTAAFTATPHGNFTYGQQEAPNCDTNAIVNKYCGDCRFLVAENIEYDGTDSAYLAYGHDFTEDSEIVLGSGKNGQHEVKCNNNNWGCNATKLVDCTFIGSTSVGADCITPGTIEQSCPCGAKRTVEGQVDSSKHKSTETIDARPATCTTDGYTGDEYCTDCDKYTGKKGTAIPATGHTWSNTTTFVKTAADCFTGTEYYQECATCGISAENDTTGTGSTWNDGKTLSHDWQATEKYNKSQANCVTDEVYYYECALCHNSSETFTGNTWKKSDRWGHNFTGDYVDNDNGTHSRKCKNAGCTETGATESCDDYYGAWTKVDADTHKHTCELCGYTPDATAHDMTAWTSTDADLKADGEHSRYCEDCGYTETEACDYDRVETAVTCTSDGYTTHTCTVCSHEYVTAGTTATGHNYTGEYKFDTATDMHQRLCVNDCGTYGSGTELDKWTACEFEYTNTGDDTHKAECKFCDNEQSEDCAGGEATCTAPAVCDKCNTAYGKADDHSFEGAAVKLEGDFHAYLCEYCGETTGIYGIGNTVNDSEKCSGGTATCSALAVCEVCGDTHGDYKVDAHKWGEWAFNGDAETKTHIRYCEYNPEHTDVGDCFSPDSTVFAADCETEGYTLNVCEFCDHEWKTHITDPLDHDWSGDWADNGNGTHTKTCQDPTCKYGENGAAKTKTENCSKDNATAVVTKPTCLTGGYTTYTCNDCGHVWEDDETAATGHSYDKKIVKENDDYYKRTSRDCTTALTYWYRCDNCDVSAETEKDKYDDETVLYAELLPALSHKFTKKSTDEKYILSPATCTAKAVYYISCANCGEKGTETFETGSVLDHVWEKTETNKASDADCINNEFYYYECALCRSVSTDTWEKENTVVGHDFDYEGGYTAATEADCFTEGVVEHWTCATCHKMFSDAEGKTVINKVTVPVLEHQKQAVAYKAATCEEDGHSAYEVCKLCSTEFGKVTVGYEKKGHNFTGAYYCDTANNYHSFLCRNNCGESGIVVNGEQIKYVAEYDGLDWTFSGAYECEFISEYVNETDENGIHSHVRACVCGNETSAVCVDAEPETFDPDCTNDGYTLHVCDECSYEWKTDIVTALGHDVTGSAASNGNGTHSVSCSRCDYKTTAEKCSGGVATCKDKAVCTICGGSYGETTGHTLDDAAWVYQNDAKCGVDGTEKNTCTVCGTDETRVAEGTALKHELSDWIYEVESTCKTEGKKYQKCTREGCDYRTKTVTEPKNENAHVWATDANGEIIWEYVGGDCGKGVTFKSTCTVCGKMKTEVREGTHEFVVSEYGATCTAPGTIKEVCATCGYVTTREGAPATGHTFDEGVVQKKATCAQEGRMLYTCTTCGFEETKTIEKTAHGWALEGAVEGKDYIVVDAKAPTCDYEGYNEHIECLHCATGIKDYEVIPATGHADNDGNGKCDECNSALYGDSGEKACGCICHKESGLMKFIYKILKFFWKLFGISQSCNCGATHY